MCFLIGVLYNANAFTSNSHSPAGSPIDKSSNCQIKMEFLLGFHMTRGLICCETVCQGNRIKLSFLSRAEFYLDPRLKTAAVKRAAVLGDTAA